MDADVDTAIEKITVAYKQYQEDRLFSIWVNSMSDKPYDVWKKELQKGTEKDQGNGTISGRDLAHL